MSKKGKEPAGLRRYRLAKKRKLRGPKKRRKRAKKRTAAPKLKHIVVYGKKRRRSRKRTGEHVRAYHRRDRPGLYRKARRKPSYIKGKNRHKRHKGISGIGAHPGTHGMLMGAHRSICGNL